MKITPRRLLSEDFKDQSWIGKLLAPLNEHISQVVQALTGNITFQDNLFSEIKELEVRDSDLPLKFRCKYVSKPKAVFVGQCEEISGSSTLLPGPVTVDWEWAGQVVTIKQVFNINAATKYRLNLVVIYG